MYWIQDRWIGQYLNFFQRMVGPIDIFNPVRVGGPPLCPDQGGFVGHYIPYTRKASLGLRLYCILVGWDTTITTTCRFIQDNTSVCGIPIPKKDRLMIVRFELVIYYWYWICGIILIFNNVCLCFYFKYLGNKNYKMLFLCNERLSLMNIIKNYISIQNLCFA